VCREYFSIIFNVKTCALYSIKYGINYRVEFILSVFKLTANMLSVLIVYVLSIFILSVFILNALKPNAESLYIKSLYTECFILLKVSLC